MPLRKQAKAAAFTAADAANVAKANPYIQRMIDDAELRDNVRTGLDSARSAFERLSNAKRPSKALEDKKLQADLRVTAAAVREVTKTLSDIPRRRTRRGLRLGRKLAVVGVAGGAALVANEGLRAKVLDKLFGAEEEFQYSPPASTPPPASAA